MVNVLCTLFDCLSAHGFQHFLLFSQLLANSMSITENKDINVHFFYFTAVATKFNVCLCVISDTVKKQLQKRAIKTMMGLGKHFQTLDRSGDGVLDKQELQQALAFYHIQVPDEVWRGEGGNFTEYFCILVAPPNSNIIRVCKSIL